MLEYYYIDLGSSTIKIYNYKNNKLSLIDEHSIYFKNNFTEETGISDENKKALYNYFEKIKEKYKLKYESTNVLATGIFRNLKYKYKQELVRYFNDNFDLHFNIISHGIENYYLGKAMENDYKHGWENNRTYYFC